LLLLSPLAYAVVFVLLPWVSARIGLVTLILLLPLLAVVTGPLALVAGVAAAVVLKRVLIGRYAPARVSVWSGYHVRCWMVQQVVRLIPWRMIQGTEFQCMALRALGARIGSRVHLHLGVDLTHGGWDLLDIGDDVTVSQDAAVRLMCLEEGRLVVGPVTLADRATLDVRSGVGPGTHVGVGAWLGPLSSLPAGASLPDGERWDGVPARRVGRAPLPPVLTRTGCTVPPRTHGMLMLVADTAVRTVLYLPLLAAGAFLVARFGITYGAVLDVVTHPLGFVPVLSLVAAFSAVALVLGVALEAGVARALGRVREGVIGRWSLSYIRVWLKAELVRTAGNWLSGGLYWPVWLRWAGMTVGPGCEISTIIDVVPELVEIGADTFLADGIYLGGPRLHAGTVTLAGVRLRENTFVGNHAVIAGGQRLPEDILIGICTVADDRAVRPGTSWFGLPAFELPRREIVSCDRSLTHDPSLIRVVNRLFWEWLRFAIPTVPFAVLLLWGAGTVSARSLLPPVAFLAAGTAAVNAVCGAVLALVVLALKWMLLGRVRPRTHPLWSCWCSRWDFLYVAWAVIASPVLAQFEGTLLLAVYLRRMGMRIGRRVVLGGGFAQVVDPDMIEVGDGATVNAMFQAHTFEDRVLKIGRVRVGAFSTLGDNTVPLYGADVGTGTYVAPHSVVMKHEYLVPGLRYEGAPTQVEHGTSSDIVG
jgi:non-ribosomal peptide synthetase-like protein